MMKMGRRYHWRKSGYSDFTSFCRSYGWSCVFESSLMIRPFAYFPLVCSKQSFFYFLPHTSLSFSQVFFSGKRMPSSLISFSPSLEFFIAVKSSIMIFSVRFTAPTLLEMRIKFSNSLMKFSRLFCKTFFSLVLLWIPVILLIFVRKRFVSFEKLSPKLLLLFFISAVVTHVVALSAVYISGKERNSAYDLYYHQSLPILSVERLGLFTTMRIDFFRYLIGWSPNIKEVSKVPVRANGNSGYEKQPFPEKETTPNEPNVLDIDFERLIKEEKNKQIVEMHQYFSQVEPRKKMILLVNLKDII